MNLLWCIFFISFIENLKTVASPTMFIQTFQLWEERVAVSDPVYTGPTKFSNRQVLYLCNPFTRNCTNSVTDCSTVYTSQHKFADR